MAYRNRIEWHLHNTLAVGDSLDHLFPLWDHATGVLVDHYREKWNWEIAVVNVADPIRLS
jgi:hypothetical protein